MLDAFTNESIVLLIGFIIFSFFLLFFFILSFQKEKYFPALLVMSITTVSYAVMLEGSFAVASDAGEVIHYTRWLFYIGSCSLLMYSISKLLKIKKSLLTPILVFNGLVMLTGALAAVSCEPCKWAMFILSCFFFMRLIVLLFQNQASSTYSTAIKLYIFLGWSMFPVVFLLAPEGLGAITAAWATVGYLVLDVFTKIVFYLHLSK